MNKRYTAEEMKFIEENRYKYTGKELANKLGRTTGSISGVLGVMEFKHDRREYALYKGDDLLEIGTLEEIAREQGVKMRTIKFYGTPAYRKRTGENGRRLICLDEEV